MDLAASSLASSSLGSHQSLKGRKNAFSALPFECATFYLEEQAFKTHGLPNTDYIKNITYLDLEM